MSVGRRLVQSFGAILLGPAVSVVVQVINVPVMLHMWGPQLFGEWLLLSAVPIYLLLTDLGFSSAAGSDMTMRVHAGDRDGALETFHSTIVMVGAATAAIAAILFAVVFALPLHRLLHLSAMGPAEARWTFLLLCVDCLVVLQWGVLTAAYRCTERYAKGMLAMNTVRIATAAGFIGILLFHLRPLGLAAYMVAVSTVGTIWLLLLHRQGAPWLPIGVRHASRARVRAMVPPAMGFLAIPACAAISTQGMTIIAGILLGPLAVVVFNPLRTLSRTALQLTDAVKYAVWPELSAAFGAGNLALARRLHRVAFQASLVLSCVALLLLLVFGHRVFNVWTHGRLSWSGSVFHLLLLTVFANSLWNASSAVPLSANRHGRLSAIYLALSVASIGVAIGLARLVGLAGVAGGMLFADAGMALVVLRLSNGLLEESFLAFAKSCLRPRDVWTAVRSRLPFGTAPAVISLAEIGHE